MTDRVVPTATGRLTAPRSGFNPSDEELISYLKRKVQSKPMILDAIEEVDVYKHEDPSDLPEKSKLKTKDQECFFFTTLEKHGEKRATNKGYWHQIGEDKEIKPRGGDDGEVIGKVKRLVYNRGLPPNNQPTNWVIYEYHLVHNAPGLKTDAYVLCLLSHNNGNINAPVSGQELEDDDRINEKIQQESKNLFDLNDLPRDQFEMDVDDACLFPCVLNKQASPPLIPYKRKRQTDSLGSSDDDNSSQTTHHQDSIPSAAAMLEEISEPEAVDTTMVESTSSYTAYGD